MTLIILDIQFIPGVYQDVSGFEAEFLVAKHEERDCRMGK